MGLYMGGGLYSEVYGIVLIRAWNILLVMFSSLWQCLLISQDFLTVKNKYAILSSWPHIATWQVRKAHQLLKEKLHTKEKLYTGPSWISETYHFWQSLTCIIIKNYYYIIHGEKPFKKSQKSKKKTFTFQ